jgi:(E)-4-hydroxy-3-methyl-but-2-enyl pyrophosphate reductase
LLWRQAGYEAGFGSGGGEYKNYIQPGPVDHNPQQVKFLAKKGVKVASDLDLLSPGDTLIIRSHGTSPHVLEKARAKALAIIDATCPFVLKAQKLAGLLADEGYQVVIVGESDHPEVIGLRGYAGDEAQVVEEAGDVKELSVKPRIGIIAQTTQSLGNFREVVGTLLEKSDELKVFNTICHATTHRQQSALDIAGKVDLMIVIGGYNSANTSRLASLCTQSGVETHHIETAGQLEASWLEGVSTVGVTAGASTPEWIIEKVIERLEDLGRKNS